ncbi:MAG: TOBE domain-containing protein [Puia sp.]|nr:TOBE domain-containing protein [Puia sp.]
MNILTGTITEIRTEGNLSLITVGSGGLLLHAIVIDTPDANPLLAPGKNVQILFKETETIIAKGWQGGLSIRNRIPCRIESVEVGALLSLIKMRWKDQEIGSVITAGAVDELQLKAGDEVLALVKTNEVMVGEGSSQ